ncbi:Uncharacterised protein [Clostridioides difficile]|uniref:Uncharacterized protein n=1 Tax=Clostridioides difficile TaxID=1496 RepID=A0A9Q7WTK4_CLODI|nr:hypothetical protein CDFC105_100909 [Clostridioides difficile]SJO23277.1 Uncharacterised protein [Clostridioides difficile]SJO70660.1 Uncharacterised protein [Clostridioides difficile]SJO88923.1 Uncharacterised protein [Clostridioides difficile]SJO93785.1 Uncharacterised protein [Clostridioides difficile]
MNTKAKAKTIGDISPLNKCLKLNRGIFDFPIILKLIEYSIPITKIPESKLDILNLM